MTQEQSRTVPLTDKHIVFGVMALAAVAVVAFLLGVFVGRGVLAARPSGDQTTLVAPAVVPDPAAASEPESGVPEAVAGQGASALPPGDLTYTDRLTKRDLPQESLGGGTGPAPPSPPPEAPAEPVSTASPADPTGGAAQAGQAPFTVQIAAVRRRAEAQSIVDRLTRRGFPAYVFAPPGADRTGGFRVRVGSFKSRAEAEAMASRLQKEEQYQPWITR